MSPLIICSTVHHNLRTNAAGLIFQTNYDLIRPSVFQPAPYKF